MRPRVSQHGTRPLLGHIPELNEWLGCAAAALPKFSALVPPKSEPADWRWHGHHRHRESVGQERANASSARVKGCEEWHCGEHIHQCQATRGEQPIFFYLP